MNLAQPVQYCPIRERKILKGKPQVVLLKKLDMLPVSDFNFKIENKDKTDFIGKVKLKILIVFAVILSSLFGAQIVIAGTLTADGKKLQEINKEAAITESENLYLKSQIAQISSLSNLSQKANTLGFNKPLIVLDP